MALSYQDQAKVDILNREIKRLAPSWGYRATVGASGRITGYTIDGPLGHRTILEGKLLAEMESLAIHCKISIPEIYSIAKGKQPFVPPRWLGKEAQEFCYRAKARAVAPGVYRFGRQITIPVQGKVDLRTNEHLIWVGTDRAEPFRYYPADRVSYQNQIDYDVGMSHNRSMYDYIEKQKLPPSTAREKLRTVDAEMSKALLRSFFQAHDPFPSFIRF
jgi:hypothetical protein